MSESANPKGSLSSPEATSVVEALYQTIQRRAAEHGTYTMAELLLAGIYEELVAARLSRESTTTVDFQVGVSETPPKQPVGGNPVERARRGPGRPRKTTAPEATK